MTSPLQSRTTQSRKRPVTSHMHRLGTRYRIRTLIRKETMPPKKTPAKPRAKSSKCNIRTPKKRCEEMGCSYSIRKGCWNAGKKEPMDKNLRCMAGKRGCHTWYGHQPYHTCTDWEHAVFLGRQLKKSLNGKLVPPVTTIVLPAPDSKCGG